MQANEFKVGEIYSRVFPHDTKTEINPVKFLGYESHPDYGQICVFTVLDKYNKMQPLWDIFQTTEYLQWILPRN